jgi:hypothetical protein
VRRDIFVVTHTHFLFTMATPAPEPEVKNPDVPPAAWTPKQVAAWRRMEAATKEFLHCFAAHPNASIDPTLFEKRVEIACAHRLVEKGVQSVNELPRLGSSNHHVSRYFTFPGHAKGVEKGADDIGRKIAEAFIEKTACQNLYPTIQPARNLFMYQLEFAYPEGSVLVLVHYFVIPYRSALE